ncbi:MAG: sulfatase-like hydrolase/transferase [Acidimicrobiaceae bacterium]|nr:sulfatase-like hydrolase/transferase [Acidimicrobiaceae bacterium]
MPPVAWRLLHLLVLATLAITQPLLSTLGENPTFFVAHSTTPQQILAFAAIVALVPAALLGALMLAGHAFSPEAGGRIFYASMTVLAFVFVLQVVDAMPGPPVAVAAVAAAVSFGLMILYATRRLVRSAVSVLSVFPVAVVALFLFGSPVTSIAFPEDLEAVALDDLLGADPAAEHLATDSLLPASPAPDNPTLDDRAAVSPAPTGPATTGPAPTGITAASAAPTSTTADPDAALQPASMAERLSDRFPPIYILVLDELPWASLLDASGRIDAVRYPNFARLGATSHVFSNATTTAFTTEHAVPALLTGTLDAQPAPVYSLYPDNLFTLLGGVYDVSSSDPLVDLCPPSVCNGSPPSQILDLVASDEAARSTPGTAAATNAATTTTTTATATASTTAPTTTTTTATASPTATAATTTTTTATAPASTTAPTTASVTLPVAARAEGEERSDRGGSLSLLLWDAAIVFAHLASPEDVDFGLPSIGATWGNFGRGPTGPTLAVDAAPDAEPEASPAPTTTSTPSVATEASAAETSAPSATASSPTTTTGSPATTASSPATTTGRAARSTAAAETTPTVADPAAALPTGVEATTPANSDPVDAQRIKEERSAFLDSLIFDDTRVADFRTAVAAVAASELPRLHYLHSLLPHVPWRLRPDGSTYADIQLPGYFSQWDDDPGTAHFGQQRHLLQLGLVDRLLGEYLARLEAIGDFERALVIVTADHGISFVPGQRSRGIGDGNVGGIANVPLLYKEPGQRTGTIQTQPVQLIDIVPTIAAQLEVEAPWTFDGRDMFSADPAPDRRVYGPFGTVDVPGSLSAIVETIAADMHEVFGDGSSGSLYGLGGAHSLIGRPVRDWTVSPSAHCWIQERPATTPDPSGAVGYVYGRIDASTGTRIAVALAIDGVVAGTGQSYRDGSVNRVYVIGDPQFRRGGSAVFELHEIVDERLAPIAVC